MTDIELLFQRLDEYVYYPETMMKVRGEVSRTAFFPGGKGTYDNSSNLANKPIMLLGQDFDCETNYKKALIEVQDDIRKNPTWRNILQILYDVNVAPDICFFTNVILGIRKGSNGTGKSPAFEDRKFIDQCRDFFFYQLEIQKPESIFVLGKCVAEFLAATSNDLKDWAHIENFKSVDDNGRQVKHNIQFSNGITSNLVLLTHPSFRPSNVGRRKYQGLQGHDAELKMIRDILV
jgi:uracil-DNA glycosylase